MILSQIDYNVYEGGSPFVKRLDHSLITLSPAFTICSAILIMIVEDDDESLSYPFHYDMATKDFTIDTKEHSYVGIYQLKIVASFEDSFYTQKSELPFKANLIDYDHCLETTLTNPG